MLTEILPFGVITNVYSNIKNKKKKKRIAQSFGLQVAPFESWLTIITVTRNSCCHHARVWNRVFSIRATMPIRMSRPWITLPTDPLKVYFDMCIIKYFLDIISPNNDMLDKMNRLFATFSAGLSEKSSKCVCFSILFVFLPCRSEFCYACCRDTKVSEKSGKAKGPEQQTIA